TVRPVRHHRTKQLEVGLLGGAPGLQHAVDRRSLAFPRPVGSSTVRPYPVCPRPVCWCPVCPRPTWRVRGWMWRRCCAVEGQQPGVRQPGGGDDDQHSDRGRSKTVRQTRGRRESNSADGGKLCPRDGAEREDL